MRIRALLYSSVAAVLLAATFLFGFNAGKYSASGTQSGTRALESGFPLLREAASTVGESAIDEISSRRLERGAVRGLLDATGDKYAEYFDPDTYRNFKDLSEGRFSGIGIYVKKDQQQIKVVSVVEGSPAARAGIVADDILEAVDGRRLRGTPLDAVVVRIKGRSGTKVRLTVVRAGRRQDLTLVRQRIQVPSVSSRKLDKRLGLVQVTTFTAGTGDRLRRVLGDLSRDGVKGLILDLRGNPGGLLDEAVEVSSAFLQGGKVVSFRERGRPEVVHNARGRRATDLPLVILVDEGSASASEVVAGALQDRGRAVLVGTRTYGKGSVQQIFPLSDKGALKLTIASYFTPSGRSIGEKGIPPDVEVEEAGPQLARAETILTELLASAPARSSG